MKKPLKQAPLVIKHASPDDPFKDNYGDRDMIQSTVVNDKTFTRLGELN